MKLLSGLLQPQWVPCGSTRLVQACIITPQCKGQGNGKGFFQNLIDTKDGSICQSLLESCDC